MDTAYPSLNLPSVELRTRIAEGSTEVWDVYRRIWVALTPEEWVRQHVASMLCRSLGAEPTSLALEYPVKLNGQDLRADIVVVDRDLKPRMLVECKAPDVAVTKAVLEQAERYNSVVRAKYIVLSNGIKTFCFRAEGNSYEQVLSLPDLSPIP